MNRLFFYFLFVTTGIACNNVNIGVGVDTVVSDVPEKEPLIPLFSSYTEAIEAMRFKKNNAMLGRGIIEKDKATIFKGLNYFAPDSTYIFKASIELLKPEKIIFRTTDERTPEYYKFCKLNFKRNGVVTSLFGYVEGEGVPKSIFIPFKDATSNKETYGGGRYIDLDYNGEKTMILLDFNYSYNPYCHYNHEYSCPLVPVENVLSIPIYAGEKKLYE